MKVYLQRFQLGETYTTQGIVEQIDQEEIQVALTSHVLGDWGDFDEEDKQANEDALVNDSRLLSKYRSSNDTVFWIITEWDRSQTTVLLPSEY